MKKGHQGTFGEEAFWCSALARLGESAIQPYSGSLPHDPGPFSWRCSRDIALTGRWSQGSPWNWIF